MNNHEYRMHRQTIVKRGMAPSSVRRAVGGVNITVNGRTVYGGCCETERTILNRVVRQTQTWR